MRTLNLAPALLLGASLLGPGLLTAAPPPGLDPRSFEFRVRSLALECRDEAVRRIEALVASGKLTQAQVFDTFYVPIPNTYPQKFHTQYDRVFDEALRPLLDDYLGKHPRFVFFILSDLNGYVPTHNSAFTKPLTGNREKDAKGNRTKLMFNDRTGLAASRNTAPHLLQEYQRDTGETMYDLSVPVYVGGRHWGCVRVGFRKE
ncbi:MAG: chemotaxis protein [Acidobacteria bacterium]|nr:chemotaxis protein [Acidobacteriota bacterium]